MPQPICSVPCTDLNANDEHSHRYLDACPDMSMFLAGCLYCLAFGPILICCMVVSFEGYATKSPAHIAYAPLMHFGAALLVGELN